MVFCSSGRVQAAHLKAQEQEVRDPMRNRTIPSWIPGSDRTQSKHRQQATHVVR